MSLALWTLLALAVLLGLVVLYDVTQKRHAVIHNFPVIGLSPNRAPTSARRLRR